MADEISKLYEPAQHEKRVYEKWLAADAFAAVPDGRADRYVVMMPLPNVTGALHMGHALDNTMQDLLVRWHRMMGDNTLWMPGTDHAGIGTQAVVEKRLFELEGKTRHDIGRTGLVARIQAWKDEYRERIIRQQQAMGFSCDWKRQRFTMDPICARAVREAFFRLFRDGLIYRGNRLVNWDCQLETAVSDDEIVYEKVQGHFWYVRYPVLDRQPDEPEFVVVATTRPETMLGDMAIAVHPDPEGELNRQIKSVKDSLKNAAKKDREELEKRLKALEMRKQTHLPLLRKLRDMARHTRFVQNPAFREPFPHTIILIEDEWADPSLGTGCVKITPAHDPNDYAVWIRRGEKGFFNILNANGTINNYGGHYAGLDRFEARKKIVADLKSRGLIESVEDREIEIGHSDRSKTAIEPYLSKQWFVRMNDIPGGITCGAGTKKVFRAPGLAQAAIEASRPGYKSPSGRRLTFAPDDERYGGTYRSWLGEKRDWCISRQLWWGHRIPIWQITRRGDLIASFAKRLPEANPSEFWAWVVDDAGNAIPIEKINNLIANEFYSILVCLKDEAAEKKYAAALEALGLLQDPDVLDTWFSSALWPMSTLGWPDPVTAILDPGQRPLTDSGFGDALSYYYPGSCLVTARDIITLWVARMTIMGLYLLGDVPFTDSFIHANIQDGKGERMSKSKGNGIDPEDIIEKYGTDAMRYVLCDMQTGTQDIRLPVQAVSPYSGELVDLATAKHGRSIFTYIDPKADKEFDVLGTMPDIPPAKIISERFDIGRAFCTKLWNAARFMFGNLGEHPFTSITRSQMEPEDRWILSRLSKTVREVTAQLEAYNPSAAVGAARDFFWGDLCDRYLEYIKPRMKDEAAAPAARSVLALAFDHVLRLFHPFVPFITEVLWERLNEQCPVRGLLAPMRTSELLITASWPAPNPRWEDEAAEADFALIGEVIRSIREMRSLHNIPPSRKVAALIRAEGPGAAVLESLRTLIINMAGLESLVIAPDVERPATAASHAAAGMEIYVPGLIDPGKEKERLASKRAKLAEDLRKAEAKLSNEGFVARAPADVVERERAKLTELKAQVESIDEGLKARD
jgi:valyl-tRNA synthetase